MSIKNVKWAKYALWAPSVIQANGKYYLFFGANDIQNEKQKGGIGVAVSDSPAGPYKDALGKPLIDKIIMVLSLLTSLFFVMMMVVITCIMAAGNIVMS